MFSEAPKVRKLPQSVQINQEVIQEALDLGCTRAKVIQTQSIALAHWVKLQCQYGCPHFGKSLTCPPYSPTPDEMAEVLVDYHKALLIDTGENGQAQDIVVQLENKFKSRGFFKAFALCSKPCNLCNPCTIESHCRYPEKARPTLKACGINVHQTVFNNDWGELEPETAPCSENHSIALVLLD